MAKRGLLTIGVIATQSICAVFALTYPHTAIRFPVLFSFGADREDMVFDVPLLHTWVQVEVVIGSGTSLWTATIIDHDDVVWTYSTHHGSQTTYRSEWIAILSGQYNFTYATAGLESLEAEVTVDTKGGVW